MWGGEEQRKRTDLHATTGKRIKYLWKRYIGDKVTLVASEEEKLGLIMYAGLPYIHMYQIWLFSLAKKRKMRAKRTGESRCKARAWSLHNSDAFKKKNTKFANYNFFKNLTELYNVNMSN